MNQDELVAFFNWCGEVIVGFDPQDCDESTHFYVGDDRIGGYAGDTRQYFLDQNDATARLIRMMDADTSVGVSI
jgi:hypothetical protein